MAENLLDLTQVVVEYGHKVALEVHHLTVTPGEVLALLGPNGAGKTTLLRVMGLLQAPTRGTFHFDGTPASSKNALAVRRRIATVFQEPLLLNTTVYQNAALGLRLRGLGSAEIAQRVEPWLERLGIAHLAARSARTLSGGEAQRTSLVRALALNPELLLLDEPFGALDPASREDLLRDFRRILEERRVTTVFVTHDRGEAFRLADRVAVMVGGRLLQLASREEVFFRPGCARVAEIVGVENRLSGWVEERRGADSLIALGGTKIRTPAPFLPGTKVIVCIRAEDVVLAPAACRTPDPAYLRGTVSDVFPGLQSYRYLIDCAGFRLVASTERAEDSAICRGEEVTARFRPAALHVIADEKDR